MKQDNFRRQIKVTGVFDDDIDLDEFNPNKGKLGTNFDSQKLIKSFEETISEYINSRISKEDFISKFSETTLMQLDVFSLDENINNQILSYSSQLVDKLEEFKQLKEEVAKENSKNIFQKIMDNFISFITRTKTNSQILKERSNLILNSNSSLLQEIVTNVGNNKEKNTDLEAAGRNLLAESNNHHLVDLLLKPEELDKLTSQEVKTLYYLTIRNFSRGGDEKEEWDKIEEFDTGRELCTKEKMLKYLHSMVKRRNQLNLPISKKEIIEYKLAKISSKLENFKEQLSNLESLEQSKDYSACKEIVKQLEEKEQIYNDLYDRYIIQDIAGNSSRGLKDAKIIEGNITEELSKHKSAVKRLNRTNYDDFEENMHSLISSGQSIEDSVNNSFKKLGIELGPLKHNFSKLVKYIDISFPSQPSKEAAKTNKNPSLELPPRH